MITEAEIQSIDYNSNSCIVRIPLFETVGSLEQFIATAKICIQPGIYNGYTPGDAVWVDFINGRNEYPIVVGKIFQGQTVEKNSGGSAIVSPSINVSTTMSIPNETKINNAFTDFDTVQKIINNIKNIQENIDNQNTTWDKYSTNEIQIGYWIDDKPLYRKAIYKTDFDLPYNTEVEIGDIGAAVDNVIDIKQTATYMPGDQSRNNSAYDMYYSASGTHSIIGCRVDLTNGKIYAQSCNDSWTGTTLIVIVEYTKV